MTDQCREAFEKWFLEKARATIDPWHKEFAWTVWQAAWSARPVVLDVEREALEAVRNWYNNQDGDVPLDAGCIECTAGTVPNDLNTGLCAFHKVFKVLK